MKHWSGQVCLKKFAFDANEPGPVQPTSGERPRLFIRISSTSTIIVQRPDVCEDGHITPAQRRLATKE